MFKAGDKVRVLPGEGNGVKLFEGEIYTVVSSNGYVWLEEAGGGWWPDRFELVQEESEFLKVGDTIRISEQGRQEYEDSLRNPYDEVATIAEVRTGSDFCYVVNWPTFAEQTYRKDELELVEEGTPSVEIEEGTKEVTNVIYTYSGDSATVVIDGKVDTVTSGEANFGDLVEALKQPVHDVELIKSLVNKKAAVEAYAKGNVEIKGSAVYYKGEVVNDSLTEKMLQLMDEGFDIGPWVAFFENLMENPSYRSRQCLFNFLEKFQAPFTPDGCFIAFKRVTMDFKDIYTKKMDNSVGAVVKMDRRNVNEDPSATCSAGLHVAASSYLDSYANASGAKTVMLKVNPRDVVAVPKDYNFAKMRVCQYEVIADITVDQMQDLEKRAVVTPEWDTEEEGYDWEVGDYITFDDSHGSGGYDLYPGEEYEILEVDHSDNTVKVRDDEEETTWLNFDGTKF